MDFFVLISLIDLGSRFALLKRAVVSSGEDHLFFKSPFSADSSLRGLCSLSAYAISHAITGGVSNPHHARTWAG